MNDLQCPNCNSIIIKCNADYIKIMNKTVIFRNNKGFSVCKGCNREIEIPISINIKSLRKPPQPKLVVSIKNKK